MAGLLERLRRLAGPASDPRPASAAEADTQPVRACTDRQLVTLRGTLVAVRPRPTDQPPGLVAELDDGSGTVELVWLGRRRIGGVCVGSVLEVEGRVSCHADVRRIHNPRYTLLSVTRA